MGFFSTKIDGDNYDNYPDYHIARIVTVIAIALIGALLAFSRFNWFPARIFGGDSLTLIVGANLAVMSIIGNMKIYGILLFALFYIEFLIKAKHKMKSECFGIPTKKKIGVLNS